MGVHIFMGEQSSDVISRENLCTESAHAVHSNGDILTKGDDVVSVECYKINGSNHYKIRDYGQNSGIATLKQDNHTTVFYISFRHSQR